MDRTRSSLQFWLVPVVLLVLLAKPARAFGAGNIASAAKIEGQNWRHGDIEDTLLTLMLARVAGGKKFSKMDVKRTYFGNWLRDYSQAVDVGTVKMVSAEAIRILLWVLGFMTFGYGTKEFEVTTDRLGCYRPEEHIDNPKDYADNIDARDYDPRLRGPVDNQRELGIDPNTGLKNYIANERAGIMTSAELIRKRFGESIRLGRAYGRSNNKADLYEALRLIGTGCHCLEDFSAHSNYTELALIELGVPGVFPHVGRQCVLNIPGASHPVFPIVTGTFGGVDFLHSVMGEFSDKATQSEVQELEGTIESSANSGGDSSILRDILSKLPSGIIGGDQAGKADELQNNAQAAQMQQMRVSPRQPEEFTRQMQEMSRQIYPILEWHDEIMLSISETIEKIPVLPELIEQVQDQINMFVFSLLAPFVLPIIRQVKTELSTGSSEIIQSSKDKQLIVFNDDRCDDPTHSMLSKDHFSNQLNEPAGKIASAVLKWVVPQLMQCWDDEGIDVNRTISRIINGVFHHPAVRDYGEDGAADGRRMMFGVVQKWWGEQDRHQQQYLTEAISRDGVLNGRNHKEGVHDSGHGCGKPLGMTKSVSTAGSSGGMGAASGVLGGITSALGGGSSGSYGQQSSSYGGQSGGGGSSDYGNMADKAVGGGVFGAAVGGLVGVAGGGMLSGVFGEEEKKKKKDTSYGDDGSYTETYKESGRHHKERRDDEERYGSAQYSQTTYPSGGRHEEYSSHEQSGSSTYGYQQKVETTPSYGGGYEQRTETRYDAPGGYQSENRNQQYGGEYSSESYGRSSRKSDDEDSDSSKKHHKHKKHHKKDSDDEEDSESRRENYEGRSGGYGGGDSSYGQSGYGQGGYEREESSYGRSEEESYGEQEESSYGGGGYSNDY
ncbi:MAG: hypothetical protein M1814_003823 [Vezdaea aestivalis]|nr:MAG: hypothetical protein M1814_003823 [Vezdaea aestivalis]